MSQGQPEASAVTSFLLRLLATVLVAAIGAVIVTNVLDRGRWEQARIGLTEQSEWPMHDVHLATTAGQLDDTALVPGVQAELGLAGRDDIWVELDHQRQDGSGVVVVSGHADKARDAALVANAVAELMVERVQPDTPVRVVDRADGTDRSSSTIAVLAAGSLAGLMIGLVVWPSPESNRRRPTEP